MASGREKLNVSVSKLESSRIVVDPHNLIDNLFRTPKYTHTNIDPDSLANSTLGNLPSELLEVIYQMLDVKSVLQLALACKALGMIANDKRLRERLYKAKYPGTHFTSSYLEELRLSQQQTGLSPLQLSYTSFPSLQDALQLGLIQNPEPEIYNDEPAGMGFVIKR